jgi:hypothetical protein
MIFLSAESAKNRFSGKERDGRATLNDPEVLQYWRPALDAIAGALDS